MKAFIDDGYTEHAVISGTSAYAETRVSFRPLTNSEQVSFVRACQQYPESAGERVLRVLASHITEWSLDRSVTTAALDRLHPELFAELQSRVLYWSPKAEGDQLGN